MSELNGKISEIFQKNVGDFLTMVGISCSILGTLFGGVLQRLLNRFLARACTAILYFLLSQPSQISLLWFVYQCVSSLVFVQCFKWCLFSVFRKLSAIVNNCPKDALYSLWTSELQRNLWRLWKQKVENTVCTRVYACARMLVLRNVHFYVFPLWSSKNWVEEDF